MGIGVAKRLLFTKKQITLTVSLNDKVAGRTEFNKTQRMVGSPLIVLRDESQILNIVCAN